MNRATMLQHGFATAHLLDPSLRTAAEQLGREGQSLIEAGAFLAQHETIGTLLDLVG